MRHVLTVLLHTKTDGLLLFLKLLLNVAPFESLAVFADADVVRVNVRHAEIVAMQFGIIADELDKLVHTLDCVLIAATALALIRLHALAEQLDEFGDFLLPKVSKNAHHDFLQQNIFQ